MTTEEATKISELLAMGMKLNREVKNSLILIIRRNDLKVVELKKEKELQMMDYQTDQLMNRNTELFNELKKIKNEENKHDEKYQLKMKIQKYNKLVQIKKNSWNIVEHLNGSLLYIRELHKEQEYPVSRSKTFNKLVDASTLLLNQKCEINFI